MRRSGALTLMAVLFVGTVFSCAMQTRQDAVVDTTTVKAGMDSLNQGFMAALAARDTDAVVAFFTDDARVLPPNAPRADGPDAIRALWASFMGIPGMALELHSTDVIVAQAGDLAVDIGTYKLTFSGPDQRPVEDVGKYVTVVKKVNGQWKILVDTFNSDLSTTAT